MELLQLLKTLTLSPQWQTWLNVSQCTPSLVGHPSSEGLVQSPGELQAGIQEENIWAAVSVNHHTLVHRSG